MRSPENVLESLKSKACNKSYKYERLYRNLYNPQFYRDCAIPPLPTGSTAWAF